jgi:hypothetical protein
MFIISINLLNDFSAIKKAKHVKQVAVRVIISLLLV